MVDAARVRVRVAYRVDVYKTGTYPERFSERVYCRLSGLSLIPDIHPLRQVSRVSGISNSGSLETITSAMIGGNAGNGDSIGEIA